MKKLKRLYRRLTGRTGMPNFKTLGMSFEDARRISSAKSIYMVEWLRARRSKDQLRGFYRRQHLTLA